MTWQDLADKYLDKAGKYIDQFAAKLGTTSEYIFEILVKQQIAAGISGIIFFAVLLIISLVSIKLGVKWFKMDSRRGDWDYQYMAMWASIIGLVVLLLSLAGIGYNIRLIINPEYYAIQDIVNFIKEKVGN
ncbi:putative membrane protein_gp195 [Bacillus phage vB_BceM_WH1]|nr:putative membrane protein_gp195 [Bacillus phage vB_BceM_WH1]